ncbi:glycosyltransferase family 2 protein [Mucilaginibacter flavidus]|uniref:glycosyltransferase family 2 protein n=1 Tax=Mucilaginibacter flavidus TaxID=2949309 RepID=UPI0020938592|nr:glycosyltransferase family 2 protein [Mucilaginibacter flavidus]MCO5947674.1 glycosyltransferase [Mucilaginibacter flavidus]
MRPFFSIVIPLFNCAASLQHTLDSILLQSFRDYEIVFIDGASADDTLQIIDAFRMLNSTAGVKLVSEKDNGIYDAMNKGVKIATGEWLYFMGSDDTFCSAKVLLEVYEEIQKKDADLIYGNVYGAITNIGYIYDTRAKVLSTGIHHQSVFYKSNLFEVLGEYNREFKIAADYDFTLKVFLNERYSTRYINKTIAYYGENGYSSQNFDYKFFSGHYRILARNGATEKIDSPQNCLDSSIYCCLYLAKAKKNMGVAWGNLLYYITAAKGLTLYFRVKTLLRMLMWSIRSN